MYSNNGKECTGCPKESFDEPKGCDAELSRKGY